MRSSNIVWLGLLAGSSALGCSFIDDFDKFERTARGFGDDAAVTPVDDAGSLALPDAAQPVRDSGADSAAKGDASLPPGDAGGSDAPDATSTDDGGTVTPVDAGGPGVCGDGMVDRGRGETCDDGNQLAGDGCEPVSCTETPSPTCAGVVCSDGDPCTVDVCDATSKTCTFRVIDADGDGFSPSVCPEASVHKGGDCNDGNAAILPGAPERCDGVDNNCDAARTIDEGLPRLRCYPDRDGDGFANLDGTSEMSCACASGSLSITSPADRTQHDCWDDPATRGSDVFPGQIMFFEDGYGPGGKPERKYDYDCDTQVTQRFSMLMESCSGLLNLTCAEAQGYAEEVPDCGESERYTVCGSGGGLLSCSGVDETRKQACR